MAIAFQPADIEYLLSPRAIRERSQKVFDACVAGQTHFRVKLERLDFVANYVLKVTKDNYPDLNIPFHCRNGHLNAGRTNRLAELEKSLQGQSSREVTKSKIDLIVVSVLLDAGAGDAWKFKEGTQTFSRSEGLAVASFAMFMDGAFSGEHKWRADIQGLRNLNVQKLTKYFQVNEQNPLLGVEGRVQLLNALAIVMDENPTIFKSGRVGDMLDYLLEKHSGALHATDVLDFLLRVFGEIWPSRIRLGQQNMGDVWIYPPFGPVDSSASLIPFHKLSQWLAYSILVPIIEMGVQVNGVQELTGLAEYRNGGLILDSGLIQLRDSKWLGQQHAPQSELVIEWRALTVILLDMIADRVRQQLGVTPEELPLAKVLEGGTWHAGRKIAKEKRASGAPPLNILSDGTVF